MSHSFGPARSYRERQFKSLNLYLSITIRVIKTFGNDFIMTLLINITSAATPEKCHVSLAVTGQSRGSPGCWRRRDPSDNSYQRDMSNSDKTRLSLITHTSMRPNNWQRTRHLEIRFATVCLHQFSFRTIWRRAKGECRNFRGSICIQGRYRSQNIIRDTPRLITWQRQNMQSKHWNCRGGGYLQSIFRNNLKKKKMLRLTLGEKSD